LLPVVLLVAFHAAVLLRRVGDASILRPAVLAQWAFAAVLLVAALFARRTLTRNGGRRAAIVFWILVAVLHLAPAGEGYFNSRENVALLVEVGIAAVPVVVILATRRGPVRAAKLQSGWVVTGFLTPPTFSPATCCGDRAPPLF
jgi:hypothetical protein